MNSKKKIFKLPFFIGDIAYIVDYTLKEHYVVKPLIVKSMDVSIADNYVHIEVCGEIPNEQSKATISIKSYGFLRDCFVTKEEAQAKADNLNKEYNYNYFD